MGVLEFLVPFYPMNTARVVFSLDLKLDPLNWYPNKRCYKKNYPLSKIMQKDEEKNDNFLEKIDMPNIFHMPPLKAV